MLCGLVFLSKGQVDEDASFSLQCIGLFKILCWISSLKQLIAPLSVTITATMHRPWSAYSKGDLSAYHCHYWKTLVVVIEGGSSSCTASWYFDPFCLVASCCMVVFFLSFFTQCKQNVLSIEKKTIRPAIYFAVSFFVSVFSQWSNT